MVTDLLAVKLPPCSCHLSSLHYFLSLSELVSGHICRASKLGLHRVTLHASHIKVTLRGLSQAHITELFRNICSVLAVIGAYALKHRALICLVVTALYRCALATGGNANDCRGGVTHAILNILLDHL